MRPSNAEYTIKAYAPINKGGGLVLETWHIGESSRDMEISVFRDRMKRGEIARIDVTSHVDPVGTVTYYE